MGSTSFLGGFSYPNLLLVFLNLLFLGTCIICFSQLLDFLWVFFILFYFCVPYFGLACDHGNLFFALKSKKEKDWVEVRTVFNTTTITLGQQYNVGEKPTVILYTYINRHAGTPTKGKTKQFQYIIKQ